jgi:hypothetical protein
MPPHDQDNSKEMELTIRLHQFHPPAALSLSATCGVIARGKAPTARIGAK